MDESSKRVYELVEKGLLGKGLEDDEMEFLYGVDPNSADSYYIRWAGNELSKQATDGKAEIHAQIGLNGTPCPKNCQFCSFAVCNGVRKGVLETTEQEVRDYARAYEESGANLILVLCTASYKFERLIEMVEVVREVISPELPLLINSFDLTLEQAQRVKQAGANGAYHAVRMGEGVVTNIPVETRLQTFENLKEAGLSLSTCVEPVGPEHTPKEIAYYSRICMNTHANSAGVGRRITVPGTMMEKYGTNPDLVNSLYVAVYRLATGLEPGLNCAVSSPISAASGANLAWAEVGTNPRDVVERTEKGGRGSNIEFCRRVYFNAGWEVLEGPSKGWIL